MNQKRKRFLIPFSIFPEVEPFSHIIQILALKTFIPFVNSLLMCFAYFGSSFHQLCQYINLVHIHQGHVVFPT